VRVSFLLLQCRLEEVPLYADAWLLCTHSHSQPHVIIRNLSHTSSFATSATRHHSQPQPHVIIRNLSHTSSFAFSATRHHSQSQPHMIIRILSHTSSFALTSSFARTFAGHHAHIGRGLFARDAHRALHPNLRDPRHVCLRRSVHRQSVRDRRRRTSVFPPGMFLTGCLSRGPDHADCPACQLQYFAL
jgi:hypothetical protein